MPRSRNIKPALYKNEYLVTLPFETRFMAAGLPCWADRDGRLEDRPMKLKMEMFPADNVDVNAMLDDLERIDYVKRYEIDNVKYIQIVKFSKHQNPHCKETASTIPAPDKHGASTVQAQDDNSSSTADSLNLVTDSLKELREPDKSIPHVCPHLKIIDLYHECLPMLPRAMYSIWHESDGSRELKARWSEKADHQDLEFWRGFFEAVATNEWWVNPEQWGKANLRWLIKKKRFYEVVEYWNNMAEAA